MMFLTNRVLASRTTSLTLKRVQASTGIMTNRVAYFSGDSNVNDGAAFSAAEIEANREDWGIKYQDEMHKFEKEWKSITEKIATDESFYIETDLADL